MPIDKSEATGTCKTGGAVAPAVTIATLKPSNCLI